MAKDGARSGALKGRTRAAFEGHMRWAEDREGVGISRGRRAVRCTMDRARGGIDWQDREFDDEK